MPKEAQRCERQTSIRALLFIVHTKFLNSRVHCVNLFEETYKAKIFLSELTRNGTDTDIIIRQNHTTVALENLFETSGCDSQICAALFDSIPSEPPEMQKFDDPSTMNQQMYQSILALGAIKCNLDGFKQDLLCYLTLRFADNGTDLAFQVPNTGPLENIIVDRECNTTRKENVCAFPSPQTQAAGKGGKGGGPGGGGPQVNIPKPSICSGQSGGQSGGQSEDQNGDQSNDQSGGQSGGQSGQSDGQSGGQTESQSGGQAGSQSGGQTGEQSEGQSEEQSGGQSSGQSGQQSGGLVEILSGGQSGGQSGGLLSDTQSGGQSSGQSGG